MKTMRYTLITVLALTVALCTTCRKESLDGFKQTSFNTPFDLKLTEKIVVKSDNQQVMLELRSLNDNRCYDECEDPGNATARVFMSDTNQSEAETNLCIGICDTEEKTSDSISVILDGVKYTMILQDIYGDEDKKAEFLIKLD